MTISIPIPGVTPPRASADSQLVRDLVGLLLKATRKLPGDEPFRGEVLDYLNRKGLQPSILRDEDSS